MALGPLLQIRAIVEHRSSRNVSIGYFLILLVGFVLWVAYGLAPSNLALVVPNSVAAVVLVATIAVAPVPGAGPFVAELLRLRVRESPVDSEPRSGVRPGDTQEP